MAVFWAAVVFQERLATTAVLKLPVGCYRGTRTEGTIDNAVRVDEESSSAHGRVYEPVVLFRRAAAPTAVFASPVVLIKSVAAPNAVFSLAVLKRSAPAPVAVLKLPSVLLQREYQPTAVFAAPVVRLKRAFCPSAVLNPG